MNPSLYALTNGLADTIPITKYIQTQPILTSQQVQVPPGTKRIEALMAGGGGGGSGGANTTNGSGGGFGGLSVMLIPITGSPLDITIGAGGAGSSGSTAGDGSPSYIYSANMLLAAVGGGGGGRDAAGGTNVSNPGTYGGAPGGNATPATAAVSMKHGSMPPFGLVLWHPYPLNVPQVSSVVSTSSPGWGPIPAQFGQGIGGILFHNGTSYIGQGATYGSYGGGPGTNWYGFTGAVQGFFGTGGTAADYPGPGGGVAGNGGSAASTAASFASIAVWGYTGQSAGTSNATGGAGGGGLLGSGGNGAANTGGTGALGAGGGGSFGVGTGGNGGNGFVILRFYM